MIIIIILSILAIYKKKNIITTFDTARFIRNKALHVMEIRKKFSRVILFLERDKLRCGEDKSKRVHIRTFGPRLKTLLYNPPLPRKKRRRNTQMERILILPLSLDIPLRRRFCESFLFKIKNYIL